MKIISIGSIPPEWGGSTAGGVATVHQTIINELVQHEDLYQATLLGVHAPNYDSTKNIVPPRSIPMLYKRENVDDHEWYKQIIDDLKPELVVFHHIGHRWAKIHMLYHSKIPAIGVIHSWHQLTQSSENISRKWQLIECVLGGIAGLIFPSKHLMNEGLSLGLKYECPTTIIPNPLSETVFNYSPRNIDSQKKGLIFVGSLILRKRPDMIIKAAEKLKKSLTVVGEGPERERLEVLTNHLNWKERTIFSGELPLASVIEKMANAEVLCVPSTSEPFGLVYIEAAACGTPVVGYYDSLCEIEDTIKLSIGYGVKGDASEMEICEAIKLVLETYWEREKMAETIRKFYSPGSITQQYVVFCKKILDVR